MVVEQSVSCGNVDIPYHAGGIVVAAVRGSPLIEDQLQPLSGSWEQLHRRFPLTKWQRRIRFPINQLNGHLFRI